MTIAEVRTKPNREDQYAASKAVFAVAIDAPWSREPTPVAVARELIDALKGLATQRACAVEIDIAFEDALASDERADR